MLCKPIWMHIDAYCMLCKHLHMDAYCMLCKQRTNYNVVHTDKLTLLLCRTGTLLWHDTRVPCLRAALPGVTIESQTPFYTSP
eukprot:COSAG01_NODE_2774_length_7098_cov_13.905571_9_plen_83_part_00